MLECFIRAAPLAKKTASLIGKKTDERRASKYGKKEEWILIYEKQMDRINRIDRIERPSAEGPLGL